MLYCFADHVALPSSFSDTSKTNLGCCHARTQNRYAQQQQQLKRDEWRACPDESPSMHVQVDGIEFNHRNDRSFFFFFFGPGGWGHGAGYMNGLWWRGAQWLMPREEEPVNLWRKMKEKLPCCLAWSVWRIQEAPHFPRISLLLILFSTWFLFEGAYTVALIQPKWSYLSPSPVIGGRQCCWIRHLSKAQESCNRCSFSCHWSEIQYTL